MNNFINKVSNKVAVWCEAENDEQTEILAYGFNLIFEDAYKLLLLMIIAFFIDKVFETVLIIASFCFLRYWAGGFHCKTSIACTLCVLTVWLLGLAAGYAKINTLVILVILITSIIIVALLAPCSTTNNPIVEIRIIKRKHTGAVITVCMQSVVSVSAAYGGFSAVASFIAIPVFLEAVTLIVHKICLRFSVKA